MFFIAIIFIKHILFFKFTSYIFFICSVIEIFKNVFIHYFTMDYIIIYRITIILNILDKMVNWAKLSVVEG